MNSSLQPKQLELYNKLRNLWTEHVMWTRSFIISTATNLGDLDYVTKRLLRNPADFADVLRPFYGDEKAIRFENLLTDHLLIAAKLVNAAKEADTKTVDEERKKWYANADDISMFLSGINPFWSKRNWRALFYEHLQMTEDEAVQILTGQYEASIAEYDSIQEEALKMGDYMAYGIIQQFRI
ncbi:MAG: acetylglutamate kinase [Clostridia bacterium]|nr:acetylglutamate kinase [Clostridia bacterium]